MDETSPLTEPRPEKTNNAAETSHDASNGESKPAAPRNVSRTITSKRVVIPPSAKRSAQIPPAPVVGPVTDTPPPPGELAAPANGDTQGGLYTPPPHDTAPQLAADSFEASAPSSPSPVESPSDSALNLASATTTHEQPATVPSPAPFSQEAATEIKPVGLAPKSNVAPPLSSSVKASGMPYAPTPSNFTPLPVVETPRKRRSLEWLLWVGAALLLIIAAIAVVPLLFPNLLPGFSATPGLATPTEIAIVQPTTGAAPEATTTQLPTGVATSAASVPTNAPLIIPTPPVDGSQESLVSDAALTGWFTSDEDLPHYGDDNLHAGTFQGKNLSSVLHYNLRNLPRDTKILFAAVELTGRDASRLGAGGEWQLDLMENTIDTDWFKVTPAELAAARSLGKMGDSLSTGELGVTRLNRFILSESERQMLEQQFQNGEAVFRFRGPISSADNLFTWESGASSSALNAPTLHLVFEPGAYVVVTNTPEPENVLTAAAYVVRGTERAKRLGTPTRFPPGVATATPGGEVIIVPAETAIAQNQETAIVRAQLATAIARTTGTYTPTQPFVVLFPTNTPGVIAPERLETATPIPPDADLLAIPIDYETCNCRGRILALSDGYPNQEGPVLMEPDGTFLGVLSGDLYYKLALARESYSPDRKRRLIYPTTSNGVQQVGYEDLDTGEIVFLTDFPKGIAYDASWSPDGSAIAFVSTAVDNADELWVYDFGTEQLTKIIETPGGQPWFKRPTWSPDSQKIAYWSSVGAQCDNCGQIWVINRDGSNPIKISDNTFDERDPVWVK